MPADAPTPPPAPGTPYLLTADEETARRAALQLTSEGYLLHEGFTPPAAGWRLEEEHYVCVGPVRTPREHQLALLAGARGAGLLLHVADDTMAAAIFEDLQRLGPAKVLDPSYEPAVDPEQAKMLAMLAAGASQQEIATALNWSLRTVSRRLAKARASLGATTTAQAAAITRSRRKSA